MPLGYAKTVVKYCGRKTCGIKNCLWSKMRECFQGKTNTSCGSARNFNPICFFSELTRMKTHLLMALEFLASIVESKLCHFLRLRERLAKSSILKILLAVCFAVICL